METIWDDWMRLAIQEARQFDGGCSPNPPVGAAVLDKDGKLLAKAAHQIAGGPHAEVLALEQAKELGEPHSLVVSLEPCNHQGRTPPCVEKILESNIRRVIIGLQDPNPCVTGGGVERLRQAGVEVIQDVLRSECIELISGFWVRSLLKRPLYILKTAWNEKGSMLPPYGAKTFTSKRSLILAHQLRKSSDAILTGSGTVFADDPLFTVRHIPDFKSKKRSLYVLDRRGRVEQEWIDRQTQLGFQVELRKDLLELYEELKASSFLKVLIEAGPTLTTEILNRDLWDLHIKIQKSNPDKVNFIYRKNLEEMVKNGD